jgi:prepilin-type N-terminal cleavage/methylation domain-containing protein
MENRAGNPVSWRAGKCPLSHFPTFSPAHLLTGPLSHQPTCSPAPQPAAGFTLIEVLVVFAILGVMASLAAGIASVNRDQTAFEETIVTLEEVKTAILGNPDVHINGAHRFSGYVTDMGELPELLGTYRQPVGLWTDRLRLYGKANLPGWVHTGASRIWVGWNGPYMKVSTGVLTDGWGNPLIFKDADTHPATVHAGNMIVKSPGANGVESGTDKGFDEDIEILIRYNQYTGAVAGYAGGDVTTVTLHYPQKGMAASEEAQLDADGYFRFEQGASGDRDIVFGIRSITASGGPEDDRVYVFSVAPTANWVGTLR